MDKLGGLMDKGKAALNKPSGGGQPAGGEQKEDYVDKALDAGEKKFGVGQSRETNEKITDQARGMFEKATGKDVPDKVSN